MTARLPSRTDSAPARPDAGVIAPDLQLPGPRVVSVSPHALVAKTASVTVNHENHSSQNEEQISALLAAGEALRVLIVQANTAVAALAQALAQGQDCQETTTRSSAHLQERLRLSARMLQAFQSQIDRVETAIGGLERHDQQTRAADEQIEKKMAELDVRMDRACAQFEDRLKSAEKCGLERFEAQLAQRQQALDSIQHGIDAFAPRLESLDAAFKNVQASVWALETTNVQSVQQLGVIAAEMSQVVHRCGATGQMLSKEVSSANEQIDRAVMRSEEIRRSVQESLCLAVTAEQSLREQLSELQETSMQAQSATRAAEALRELLPRLKPWEALLLSPVANSPNLPEPLARVAEDVQRRVNQEMGWLSTTMREVTQRIEKLASINSNLANIPVKPESAGSSSAPQPAKSMPADENPTAAPLRFQTWVGRA